MTRYKALSASLLAAAVAIPMLGFAGNANAQYYGNNNPADQQRLRCDSRDGRQNFCRPSIQANQIQMVRQFSSAQCIEGRSYGLTRDGMIWVNNGCRADFVVTQSRWGRNSPRGNAYGHGNSNGNGYATGQTFRCESNNGRENFCNVDTRRGVQLIRQISSAACINGRTWGVQNNGVWVSSGCRAEFALGGRR